MTLPLHLARIYPFLLRPLTNRQIAQKLGLSPRTVSYYTQIIYEMYDVHSREELRERSKA